MDFLAGIETATASVNSESSGVGGGVPGGNGAPRQSGDAPDGFHRSPKDAAGENPRHGTMMTFKRMKPRGPPKVTRPRIT